MNWPGGLYSTGAHEFIIREAEMGTRVAHAEDDEQCGFGPLFDVLYQQYINEQREQEKKQ
jgi:hypothetical protein